MTDFNATAGIDNFAGGSSSDRVIFSLPNQANFGEMVDWELTILRSRPGA
jgi:hypothetical protein